MQKQKFVAPDQQRREDICAIKDAMSLVRLINRAVEDREKVREV